MGKIGCIEPVVYFVNHRDPAHPEGYAMLAPYTLYPTPEGYTREEANTLSEVDRLQARLNEQERQQCERDHAYEEWLTGARREAVRDRLYAKMISSSTDQFEKDFLREWLKLRDEKKRARYAQFFEHRQMFLTAREMDSHGRRPDQERVNLDRIG